VVNRLIAAVDRVADALAAAREFAAVAAAVVWLRLPAGRR
jgi:hypothetical protein